MTTTVLEALLVIVVFVSRMIGSSDGAWCVCRPEMSDSALQKTIDYACGAGADCGPINQNGACYNPNTVKDHCSYAADSYYQRKGQTPQACDFAGTAILTQQDPSANGCTFPASQSAAGTSTGNNNGVSPGTGTGTGTGTGSGPGVGVSPATGSGGGTGTGTGAGNGTSTGTVPPTPIGINPGLAPPSTNGVLGGGLGPSGNGFSTDDSSSKSLTPMAADLGSLLVLFFSVLAVLSVFG